MKILVVDDNREFLDMMGELLQDSGYEVFLAEDGKQAREFLEDEKVDLIISDVFMPRLDGSRFHSYVREFIDASSIPFIFISGFDDEHTRSLVVDKKIDFFVGKTEPVGNIVKLIESIKSDLQLNAQ